ncbi:glycosyltransferase [Sulfurimonas sp.]|jgi:glycosyltransferase involved in cell wall biosynthesis|uniref:glycosyltransferase n=1 Tax=Sulfurimonas sp. TaxID=2022749 RepID=UPI0025FC7A41|nr:glycosyltransferase [Sulfurimonas sp.]MCK9474027.1 glycosyltransferase [Sulfurimonas sp.]MDD3505715.1 glycosyltransferase [Sulfurimonas sp.]
MTKKYSAIHQFTPSIVTGDGVSSALFFTQKVLKELGFDSEIFANHIDSHLVKQVKHIDDYPQSKNQLLLYHHSIGHKQHEKIMNFLDEKVLVYHNITPSFFFASNPNLKKICDLGREQLASSVHHFSAAYTDSGYNAKELSHFGYKNITILPILADIKSKKKITHDEAIVRQNANTYNILTVGRVVSNKCQHELINTLFYLKQNGIKNLKLFIVGKASQSDYEEYLKELTKNLELQNEVVFTGKVSDEELASYYKSADIFITLSNHEGFCIPLVEAMMYDTPTLAFNAGGIATTVPSLSLLDFKSPPFVASRILKIKNNSFLRHEMVLSQKKKLENFSYQNIKLALADFLSLVITDKVKQSYHYNDKQVTNYRIEGPFDSTYSLAIVNQQIALSLAKNDFPVSLYSTEGYGDFQPNEEFLEQNSAIDKLYKTELDSVDATLRNLYPPRTNAMLGSHKIIGPYGWEESEFLPEFVWQFNSRLTLLFCMSNYVKNLMANSGVKIPLVVTGLGVDHILDTKSAPLSFELPSGFRLLHISSAFARKGIDVLLSAFDEIIKSRQNISLIIKTFPNPHNNTKELLEEFGFSITKNIEQGVYLYTKNSHEILLINKDLEQCLINYLYENSDAFVAPTRGEGFGMPMAEAMLFELPVIVTAYGGHSDFCSNNTAWLIDFKFTLANTHMNLPNSLWAEPSLSSLIEQIELLLDMPKEKIVSKLKYAKEFISSNYSWQKVAQTIQNSLNNYDTFEKQEPNIGLIAISDTNSPIANYLEQLLEKFNKTNLTVFADLADTTLKEDKNLESLKEKIIQRNINSIIIQYDASFFSLSTLGELLTFCTQNNIQTYLFIHSIKDAKTLLGLSKELQSVTRIMVQAIEHLNTLKEFGIYQNSSLFKHINSQRFYDMLTALR